MHIAVAETCFPQSSRGEAMRLALQAGADGLELIFADDRAMGELGGPDRLSALADAAGEVGIAIPSIALTANCRTDGLIRASDATRQAMKQVQAALYGALELSAEVVLLPFSQKAAIAQEKEVDFLCQRLEDLAEEAEAIGVTLGIQCMLSTTQKLYVTDRIGADCVRLYCDVGDVCLRKLDPATEIRNLGAERICQVRFRDVLVREGQPPEVDLPMGRGHVDFPAVARSLHAIGYEDWICLAGPGGDRPIERAGQNVAYAKKVLAT